MGKYMRKSKLNGDVLAVMDVSQSSSGVRTRAKTLALQKLEKASKITATPSLEQNSESSYLQLRSRRLEKPPQNLNPSKVVIGSGDSSSGNGEIKAGDESEGYCDLGGEGSFGENNVEFDGRERSTRESTPCNSLIRGSTTGSGSGSGSGSSTRPMNQRIMPSAQEMEGFFARHAQEQQRRFADKYNFDIVNEKPLQGRYEWVKVQP